MADGFQLKSVVALLHLHRLSPPSTKAQGKRPTTPSQTMGEVCRQPGQALIEQLILVAHDRLGQGTAAVEVFNRLFAKQRKEALV
jgi:hypothetical protein